MLYAKNAKELKKMFISDIVFKRTQESEWECGWIFDNDKGKSVILDDDMNPLLDRIWDFQRQATCLRFERFKIK